jgi:hypothetical protein
VQNCKNVILHERLGWGEGCVLWLSFAQQKYFSGANPTIVSYNASTVKIYATSSLARFDHKNNFFFNEKSPRLQHCWRFSL